MTYPPDTNALSDIMATVPAVEARVAALRPGDRLTTCVIAAGGLLFGVDRLPVGRRREELRVKADRVMSLLAAIEPVPAGAVDRYVEANPTCERAGRTVGENDLWIAIVSIMTGATLVTRDADFGRVPGLMIEDRSK